MVPGVLLSTRRLIFRALRLVTKSLSTHPISLSNPKRGGLTALPSMALIGSLSPTAATTAAGKVVTASRLISLREAAFVAGPEQPAHCRQRIAAPLYFGARPPLFEEMLRSRRSKTVTSSTCPQFLPLALLFITDENMLADFKTFPH